MIQLRKGTNILTRQDVIDFPTAEKTDSYTPVSNQEIIETALEGFEKEGYRLKSETYATERNAQKFIGKFVLYSEATGIDMMFAFKNSYDKSMTAGYVLGANITICLNGAISGDEKMIRKHTGSANIDITKAIGEGIKRLPNHFDEMQKDFDKMKEMTMTKRTMAALIGDFYINENIITSRQLEVIKGEILKPSYDYGVEDSMYTTYQAITHALKTVHPTDYIKKHVDSHNYMLKQIN